VSAPPLDGLTLDQALSEVARHCDVEERLSLMRPSAKLRGYYCRSIESALREAGRLRRFQQLFPRELGSLQWYPASELLTRLVIGGALLHGPEQVHQGMFDIARGNAIEFSRTLLGRILMRLLSRDPQKLLLQGVAARRQTCSYGDMRVDFLEARTALVSMDEEYLYIDSFMLGAAHGTFAAIDLDVDAQCQLDTKFSGRHLLRW
jgi:uncharacterized protein (TIGR02265 family)